VTEQETGGSRQEGPQDPGRPEDRRGPPTEAEVSDEISREILRIHEESYGKGAERAETLIQGDWVVVILGGLELLPNEAFLVESGHQESVVQVRHHYQQAIQATYTAAVERATGRNVVAFASSTSIDEPSFVSEIFKLE